MSNDDVEFSENYQNKLIHLDTTLKDVSLSSNTYFYLFFLQMHLSCYDF